jgi:hypothetical protein
MRANSEEMRVAREVVQFLVGRDFAERARGDREVISFELESRPGWKLRSVVFSRDALRRLAGDPLREIKLDYLRRDLLRSAPVRVEYRYPRLAQRAVGMHSVAQ